MASDKEFQPWPALPVGAWPPDDTEESVAGTGRHQITITNLPWSINEVAHAPSPSRARGLGEGKNRAGLGSCANSDMLL